jgi:DNA-3-methyladenine glycosylase II
MTPEALRHLAESDLVMGRLIEKIGACTLNPEPQRTPFESLVRAVAHQQLHGKAAESILGRFLARFPGRRFPRPEDLESVTDGDLRSFGFSGSKAAAIRDIAAKAIDGTVPTSRKIRALSDEEIIDRLSACRGVGRWTVDMLLIFKLGRPDVLPVDDFGVREGFRVTYGHEAQPRPKELLAFGERWRPFRTTAAWYLWRAADAAKLVAKVSKH